MGGAGRLVLVAVGGGLALTIAVVASLDPPAPRAPAPQIFEANAPPGRRDTLRRCRTVTEPHAECAAAWEAERDRFFGRKED
ncbi:putative entry exclusion protein TrbK-alt [Sphingopyxis sp. NJF-3]